MTTVAVTLFISALFALLLLTAGQRVARVTVFLTAAALFFLLLLGILQFMSETDGALGFSQCVLPFAIALVLGVVLAAVVLTVVSNLPWMLAWLLGFMGGCLIMFFVRDLLLANHPQLINNPSFRLASRKALSPLSKYVPLPSLKSYSYVLAAPASSTSLQTLFSG